MNKMDFTNAIFELCGTLFTIPSLIQSWRYKTVQGVHWLTPLFFWSWGVWNLAYYPSLDQWFSFSAGVILTVTNTIWLYMVVFWTKKPVEAS